MKICIRNSARSRSATSRRSPPMFRDETHRRHRGRARCAGGRQRRSRQMPMQGRRLLLLLPCVGWAREGQRPAEGDGSSERRTRQRPVFSGKPVIAVTAPPGAPLAVAATHSQWLPPTVDHSLPCTRRHRGSHGAVALHLSHGWVRDTRGELAELLSARHDAATTKTSDDRQGGASAKDRRS